MKLLRESRQMQIKQYRMGPGGTPIFKEGVRKKELIKKRLRINNQKGKNQLRPHGLYSPCNSLGQNTGMDSHSLLQRIFPTQGLNPGLPHCREILYQLSHKGSPRILAWEPIPSPEDLPDPRIEMGSPALQADSLPAELSRKPNT